MSTERIVQRLKSLITMGRVKGAKSSAAASGEVTVESMRPSDELRVVQSYGFASRPQAGAEAVIVQVGSNPDQAIVIAIDDRRYRISLAGGEVALFDDLGSKVHIKRGGIIEVEATTIKLGAGAVLGAARMGDDVSIAAAWTAWFAQAEVAKAAALATLVPPVPSLPLPPFPIGVISSASSKTAVQ